MKISLSSKGVIKEIAKLVKTKNEIDEIVIKVGFADLISIDKEGNVMPYGSKEVIIKKENE